MGKEVKKDNQEKKTARKPGNVGGKFAAMGRIKNKGASGGKSKSKAQKTAQFSSFGEVDGDEDPATAEKKKRKEKKIVKVRSPLEIAKTKEKKQGQFAKIKQKGNAYLFNSRVTDKLDKFSVCEYFNQEIERHIVTVTSKLETKGKEVENTTE